MTRDSGRSGRHARHGRNRTPPPATPTDQSEPPASAAPYAGCDPVPPTAADLPGEPGAPETLDSSGALDSSSGLDRTETLDSSNGLDRTEIAGAPQTLAGLPAPAAPERDAEVIDYIAVLLRREAARHEPDRERIRARMADPGNDRAEARRFAGKSISRAVAMSAAAAAAVAVFAVAGALATGAVNHHKKPSLVGAASPRPSTSSSAPTQGGIGLTLPGASSLSALASQTQAAPQSSAAPDSATAAGSSAPPSTPTRAPANATVTVSVQPVATGRQLSFSGTGPAQDWVVVGSRQDGRQIRLKSPKVALGTPTSAGTVSPRVAAGPYVVSWANGVPEEDHTGATSWWTVTADGGDLRVQAPATTATRTVLLYLGVAGADGTVRAALQSAGTTGQAAITAGAGSTVTAAIVTITYSAASADDTLVIDLTGTTRVTGGLLGLNAIELR